MNWTLTTDRTIWELAAVAAGVVLCGVGASAFLKTSKIVAILRLGVLGAAVLLFVDPTLTRRVEEKPTVALTLDDSASARRPLGTSANVGAETVWKRCVALAKEAESAAKRRGFAVERRTLSGRTVAAFEELDDPNAETSLLRESAALETRRRDGATSRTSGESERIILFSDGIQNGVSGGSERTADGAGLGGAPVDAVAVGVSTGAFDWRWDAVDASTTVYPGGSAALRAELRLENGTPETSEKKEDKIKNGAERDGGETRRAVVRLWESFVASTAENGGTSEKGAKLVWERVVDVPVGRDGVGTVRVEREWKLERIGVFDYFLFVADIEDAEKTGREIEKNAGILNAFDFNEFCVLNNAARFRVETKEEKLDVLLVDDSPRYEYRYLRELLRREEGVALKTFLANADDATRSADETAFSERDWTRRRLAEFDAILVGDVSAERWGGKLRTLADVATRDGSETSIWLLGGSETFETKEDKGGSEGVAALLLPGLVGDAGSGDDASSADGGWRLEPTARGRAIFADAAFSAAFDGDETGTRTLEFSNVYECLNAGVGAETLFNARRRSDGRETPVFVVATLGKNKVLAQGTDELWRLRTLGDKTVYRRFVLRALEFLTDGVSTLGDAETAADVAPEFESSADLQKIKDVEKKRAKLAFETERVAARIDVLREISAATGGEALDLRDLDADAATVAARTFFERRFDEYSPVVVERSRRIVPRNLLFSFVFLAWGVAWALERRFDEDRRRVRNGCETCEK